MSKPLVYIASPYTKGDVALNVRFQLNVFDTLFCDGFVLPYAPLLSHFCHLENPRPYEDWIRFDLELLTHMDALIRLPAVLGEYRQNESPGADGEVRAMLAYGKPVLYSITDLYRWAHKEVFE